MIFTVHVLGICLGMLTYVNYLCTNVYLQMLANISNPCCQCPV